MKKKRIVINILNSNQAILDGDINILRKLYKEFRIRHPNWFQIMRQMRRSKWDGYINYIKESGKFSIGLVPFICKKVNDHGYEAHVIDQRKEVQVKPKIPKKVGDLVLREEQIEALDAFLNNRVGDNQIPFYIMVGDLAVNFGKSALFAALYYAFRKELKTILLTNDQDWLKQSEREFPALIPKDELTFVQGSKVHGWKNFTVAMVQSLSRNIDTYQHELAKIQMVLIDEADLIDNKTYQKVIQHLYNTQVRVGMSGTIYMSKLKKDLVKNMNIRSFIGNKVAEFRLRDMMDKKYSTPVTIRMVPYPGKLKVIDYEDYKYQYDRVITNNPAAWAFSLLRTKRAIDKGRLPILVVAKYIKHVENLYAYYKNKLPDLRIAYIHNEVKDRKQIIEDFRDGKYDILIASTIIARGKNLPLIKYLQNTACMDSNEKSIQILGRLVRTHDSKKRGYMDDLMFPGNYLTRHSKHRLRYYKSEELKVIKEDVKE